MKPKTHFAEIERANESDNTEYAYIICDPKDKKYGDPEYTDDWKYVDCKRCLRLKARSELEHDHRLALAEWVARRFRAAGWLIFAPHEDPAWLNDAKLPPIDALRWAGYYSFSFLRFR